MHRIRIITDRNILFIIALPPASLSADSGWNHPESDAFQVLKTFAFDPMVWF
jgi:hypothetical protein